jgi:UDP-N-acetylmuramoyl-tripeptide--D-alanyl-D-alanine ligase
MLPRWWVAWLLRRLLFRTTMIAITGSNGKTTATRYLAAILSAEAPTEWTRLNRNNAAGITETIAFCRPWSTRYAVFEVGLGYPGSIARLAGLVRPHIAVELSVFLEHRSTMKTLEATAREKAELLKSLQPGGTAVLNMDDPLVAGMQVPPGRGVIRFGSGAENDVRCGEIVSAWPQLLRFTVFANGERREIRTRLLGEHWVGSLMACVAVALHLEIPLERIARAIEQVPPYPGRMQVVELPSGAIAIRDEFKGSQHTIDAAFEVLRTAEARRRFLVFGDVAETKEKPRKRLARIGRTAAAMTDFAVFVGENAQHGRRGALNAGMGEEHVQAFSEYEEAADFLRPLLGPGDVILFKAGRNNLLPRVFFSLIGEVRCRINNCKRPMVCDDCPEFGNPELVQRVRDELTVRVV